MEILLLVLSFAFLGGSIKYIDQAYDERAFPKKYANVLAVIAGLTMGYLMAADSPFSTAFFIAMLISLFMAKKVDNLAFLVGSVCAVGTFVVFSAEFQISFMLLAIVAFLAAGFVDEIADDLAHRLELGSVSRRILTYRPFCDLAMVAMVLLGWFAWPYLLPYFSFTLAYMLVESISINGLRVPIRIRPS
jgi:hypothetical protein